MAIDLKQRAARATRSRALTLSLSLACWTAAAVQAAPAHEHGVARLDVAVEPGRVTLQLELPLDSLVGFERAPRDAAERARVDAALARLRGGEPLFRIDGSAACRLAGVTLSSAALGLGAAPAASAAADVKSDHAELQAEFRFDCARVPQPGFLETALFEAWPKLTRIEVQVAAPRGQLKAQLRRPATRVALVR